MKGRNLFIIVALICVVAATIYMAWPQKTSNPTLSTEKCQDHHDSVAKVEEGFCAPNFQLPDLSGKQHELYDYDGRPIFINFWATWCTPCLQELPYMESAYKKYKDQVRFLMINATSTEPNEQAIPKFMKKHRYTFPILLDRRETDVAFEKYKLVGLPVTIALDKNGKIIFKRVGSINEKELTQLMEKLVQ